MLNQHTERETYGCGCLPLANGSTPAAASTEPGDGSGPSMSDRERGCLAEVRDACVPYAGLRTVESLESLLPSRRSGGCE